MSGGRPSSYPKTVVKGCKSCDNFIKQVVHNRGERKAFYFCCDQCAETYFLSTCKTHQGALSKIGAYYSRKGTGWSPKEPAPDILRADRVSERMRKAIKEEEAEIKRKKQAFRRELKARDEEYKIKLRQHWGLSV